MYRKTAMAIVFLGAAIIVAGACSKSPEIQLAGSFEGQSDLQSWPADWSAAFIPDTKDYVSFEWDDQVAYTGDRSVSIAIDDSHPEKKVSYNWTRAVDGCEEGKTYKLVGWIKADGLNRPAWICVQCWGHEKGKMIGFASTQLEYPVTGTQDWTQVGTVFTVPEGTREVRVRAGISSPENRGGRVWFDGLSVQAVN